MPDCIFCKIVKGEIPSLKVFENDKVFCFLDSNPISMGHTLVIPKEHYENIFDIPGDELKKVISVVKSLSIKIKEVLKTDGINLINSSGKIANQEVFHFHFHIVPRYKNDGLEMNKWCQSKTYKADDKELKKLAEKIWNNL